MTNKTGCIAHSTPCRPSGVNNPLLFTTNRTDPKFFYEGYTWRGLHILVTVPFFAAIAHFSLDFETFWPKLLNFIRSFQKHFSLWPNDDRINPDSHFSNTVPWNRFVPAHQRRPVVVCCRKSTWPIGRKRPPTSNWRWRSSRTTTPTTSHRNPWNRWNRVPPVLFIATSATRSLRSAIPGYGPMYSNAVFLKLFSVAPPFNFTFKHKKQPQCIYHYPAFQQYVAAILAPLLRTFHAPPRTQAVAGHVLRLASAHCKRSRAFGLWFANFGERVTFSFSEFVQVQFHGMVIAKNFTRTVLASICDEKPSGNF